MLKYEDLLNNDYIKNYIKLSDKCLLNMGFTEHSLAHVTKVANLSSYILSELKYSDSDIELVKIASLLHDIGNSVNRNMHGQSGAILAQKLLLDMGFNLEDIIQISCAIGNHDENSGVAVDAITSALIIADKADVRRSRVRNLDINSFDIHDKVNYAAVNSSLQVDSQLRLITLTIELDKTYSSTLDYYSIFLSRMMFCKEAASKLGCEFIINIIEV